MALQAALNRVDAIAARLPFSLDDFVAVNEAFLLAHQQQPGHISSDIDVWTYCYIQRYYLYRLARSTGYRASDFDMLVERAYHKVSEGRHGIHRPDRYAFWVHTICRNTFSNFRRSGRVYVSIEGPGIYPSYTIYPETAYDVLAACEAITAAIDELPPHLCDVARQRLLEGRCYKEIAASLGKKVPTIRSYARKAVKQLREMDSLRMYVVEETEAATSGRSPARYRSHDE